MPDGACQAAPPLVPVAAELRRLASELQALAVPAERAFTDLAGSLTQILEGLDRLGAGMTDVSASLADGAASAALSRMREAVARSSALASGVTAADDLLKQIEQATVRGANPLLMLRGIVGEIGALATNAKVLVAPLASETLDFTVFTVEVGRLYGQALGVLDRAADRMRMLEGTIAATRTASAQVASKNLCEIDELRSRIRRCVDDLTKRQAVALQAASDMDDTSRAIAARVAECVGQLQINDMTCQRIEHVWRALDLVCDLIEPAERLPSELAVARPSSEAEKAAVVAAVCRLQVGQLKHAIDDFTGAIAGLKGNLQGLSGIAAQVLAKAAAAIDTADGGGSFVSQMRDHSDRATVLLASWVAGQGRVRGLVGPLAEGFEQLSRDLGDLRLIDEDMRIMGLNATLKCARLGARGHALGVVAQELRGCSRRAEEATVPVMAAIQGIAETTVRYAAIVSEGEAEAAGLSASLRATTPALESLEAAIGVAFAELRDECRKICLELTASGEKLVIDHHMATIVTATATRLSEIADGLGAGQPADEATLNQLMGLLGQRYTMASERVLHSLAAPGSDCPADFGSASAVATSIDDLFL